MPPANKIRRTIIKFSRRKDYQHLMRIKKGLKDLNQANLSFPEGTKIYVNDSLPSWKFEHISHLVLTFLLLTLNM